MPEQSRWSTWRVHWTWAILHCSTHWNIIAHWTAMIPRTIRTQPFHMRAVVHHGSGIRHHTKNTMDYCSSAKRNKTFIASVAFDDKTSFLEWRSPTQSFSSNLCWKKVDYRLGRMTFIFHINEFIPFRSGALTVESANNKEYKVLYPLWGNTLYQKNSTPCVLGWPERV